MSLTPNTNYLVRVQRHDQATLTSTSFQPFTITAPVHIYYVNDATVENLGSDFTTAPGSDSNDGLSAATPKASIRAVLQAYTLGSGDVIKVDEGTYNVSANITLPAGQSGFIIQGYTDANHPERRTI